MTKNRHYDSMNEVVHIIYFSHRNAFLRGQVVTTFRHKRIKYSFHSPNKPRKALKSCRRATWIRKEKARSSWGWCGPLPRRTTTPARTWSWCRTWTPCYKLNSRRKWYLLNTIHREQGFSFVKAPLCIRPSVRQSPERIWCLNIYSVWKRGT